MKLAFDVNKCIAVIEFSDFLHGAHGLQINRLIKGPWYKARKLLNQVPEDTSFSISENLENIQVNLFEASGYIDNIMDCLSLKKISKSMEYIFYEVK